MNNFRLFLILWAGDFTANIASGLTAFALGIYVFEMTGKATSVALAILFAFLPAMILNPLSGVLADRFDRRLLIILGDGCSAIGILFIFLCILTGNINEWQIYTGVGLSSIFIALIEPAYKATITDLLTKEQFAKASGLVQVAGSAKYLLSPFIAGFLLTITDISIILMIDISTIIITIPVTMLIKKRIVSIKIKHDKQGLINEFSNGLQIIYSSKGLFLLIFVISAVTFFMGVLQTLYTPLILALTDAKTLGVIQSISASGMLISSLLLGVFTITRKYVKQLVIFLISAGIFIALLGLTPIIFIIAASGFLFFACLPFINTSADVLIRTNIPKEKQGRVWGCVGTLSQLGYLLAYAVSGLLADFIFNPMLTENGILALTVGRVTGVGNGRGIGLMLIISGFMLVITAVVIGKLRYIRTLEKGIL